MQDERLFCTAEIPSPGRTEGRRKGGWGEETGAAGSSPQGSGDPPSTSISFLVAAAGRVTDDDTRNALRKSLPQVAFRTAEGAKTVKQLQWMITNVESWRPQSMRTPVLPSVFAVIILACAPIGAAAETAYGCRRCSCGTAGLGGG